MGRVIKNKVLENSRLAANYGGWMYCTACNKNIGYLCYVTYDRLDFDYECLCGSKGHIWIDFDDSQDGVACNQELITIKNRFCCPSDHSPLLTILEKNLKAYRYEITCHDCQHIYVGKK